MILESTNYEDPRVNISIFAKGDPPPNGKDAGGTAADEGDPPPNGAGRTSDTGTGDPPPNGSS